MKTEISRKLVFMYDPVGSKFQNVEMRFSERYSENIEKIIGTLNAEIAKLVDRASFHAVEIKIIK